MSYADASFWGTLLGAHSERKFSTLKLHLIHLRHSCVGIEKHCTKQFTSGRFPLKTKQMFLDVNAALYSSIAMNWAKLNFAASNINLCTINSTLFVQSTWSG